MGSAADVQHCAPFLPFTAPTGIPDSCHTVRTTFEGGHGQYGVAPPYASLFSSGCGSRFSKNRETLASVIAFSSVSTMISKMAPSCRR